MAATDITERLRQRFATEGAEATPAAVVAAVRQEPENAVLGNNTVLRLADQVRDELVGAGPLAPLLADPAVTDVLVNGVEVWVDRGSGLQRADVRIGSVDEAGRLARRLAASCGRRLDDGRPYADARLPDGSRLHAVLPPVATTGPYLSLRTFRQRPFTLDDLVGHGTVASTVAPLLTAVVAARLAYLVTGGTGSGKTTLLGTLLGLVPATERIVVVEDAAELRPTHPHVVALQARTSNVEGAGAVNLTAGCGVVGSAHHIRSRLGLRRPRGGGSLARGPEPVVIGLPWIAAACVLAGASIIVIRPAGGSLRRLREPSSSPAWTLSAVRKQLWGLGVLSPRRLAVLTTAGAAAAGLVLGGPVAAVVAAVYGALVVRAVLRRAQRQRAAVSRATALDDLCALAADLRAGLPPAIAAMASDPLETGPAAADPRLAELTAAVWRLGERTGAPAADLIERIEADARAGDRAQATAAAEAAGAQATAMLLAALPVGGIALGYSIGADPLQVLLHTRLGAACAIGAVVLQCAGLLWCERLVAGPAR